MSSSSQNTKNTASSIVYKVKGKRAPPDYHVIAPVMEALENELRDRVKESHAGRRRTESGWPVLQIHHQRTRYVYDMYHTHGRISRRTYDFCVRAKLVDAALVAKWKRPGYERLCSTYVINPTNYKFATTSVCRVPLKDRAKNDQGGQLTAQDPTTGCLGCASGVGQAPRNIFGNKYGQNLAAVQIAREKRMEAIEARRKEREQKAVEEEQERQRRAAAKDAARTGEGDSETDSDDDDSDSDDDYGPSPAAGVWAGGRSLLKVAEGDDENDNDDDDEEGPQPNNENDERPSKKTKME